MNKIKICLPILLAALTMLLSGCRYKTVAADATKRNIKSTVFNSVDVNCAKGLKVSADVYLNIKDADFMYIVFTQDMEAEVNVGFTKTEGTAKLYFNNEDVYDFGNEAVSETKNDKIKLSIKKGLNTFSLKGNDCNLDIELLSNSISKSDIVYAGVMEPEETETAS